jgi:hypothetical protein
MQIIGPGRKSNYYYTISNMVYELKLVDAICVAAAVYFY